MQGEYPAEGGVRLRCACDDDQIAPGSGRLFVCVRCGCEVVVCSCCDRGQIYCEVDCARQARRQTLHGAGRRWQRSARGRRMHAARMARYRARQREIVTHHGSPLPAVDDLLTDGATAMPRDDASPAEPPRRAMTQCPLVRSLLPVAASPRVPAPLRSPSWPCWPRPDGVQTAMVIATDVAAQMLPDVTGTSGERWPR